MSARPAPRPQSAPAARSSISSFGTNAVHARRNDARGFIEGRRRPFRRGCRGSRRLGRARLPVDSRAPRARRGITGSAPPTGGSFPAPTPAPSAAPGFATPGAKIITAGIQPTYSDPGNAGVHSVEGGGFIAIDKSRANDVGRSPASTWAPPDTPPSVNPLMGGKGGSGGSSNGPTPVGSGAGAPTGAPATAATTNRGDQSF